MGEKNDENEAKCVCTDALEGLGAMRLERVEHSSDGHSEKSVRLG